MKKRGVKKASIEISFGWIFAIIIGAVIIFFAIFTVTKFISLGQTESTTKASSSISTLLAPLENSFDETNTLSVSYPVNTRLITRCSNFGSFGFQEFSISQESYKKWSSPSQNTRIQNRYLFANKTTQGKNFIFFSKNFDFPFSVAQLIYLIPEDQKYCFLNPPSQINEEIRSIGLQNFYTTNCPENSLKVCFHSAPNCNITIDYSQGILKKDGTEIFFPTDSFMYGGIFSDALTYECQSKRLVQRLKSLTELYQKKALNLNEQGCMVDVTIELNELNNFAQRYNNSFDFIEVLNSVPMMQTRNNLEVCPLW